MNIEIPPAALEAGARALWPKWDEGDEWGKQCAMRDARAACLAMLEAWPGMREGFGTDNQGHYDTIILPLTEASDE